MRRIGDTAREAAAGDVVIGPRGVPHTFRAETPRSRLLDIHTPGGFKRFFVHAGQPARRLTPPSAGAPAALVAAIGAFGAAVVGPHSALEGRGPRRRHVWWLGSYGGGVFVPVRDATGPVRAPT